MHNIQAGDLQYLQLFSEFDRLAESSGNEKLFQKIFFLVRDQQNPYDFDYGAIGGQDLINEKLAIYEEQEYL